MAQTTTTGELQTGSAALVVGRSLLEIAFLLWNLAIFSALLAFAFTATGAGLLGLFAIAVTHERLRVTPAELRWTLRLFRLVLRSKILPRRDLTRVEVIDRGDDESTSWQLVMETSRVAANFGNEKTRINQDRLREMIASKRF